METFNEEHFSNLRRPKIVVVGDCIFLSDRPYTSSLFMACFCLLMALVVIEIDNESQTIGLVLSLSVAIIFIYDFLSLKRTRIDLKNEFIYLKSLNPLENLLGRLLQHPSKIPFSAIEKVFADYTETFGGAAHRYYLYIRTNDPYNLTIGTFEKLGDAELVASYLARKVKT